MAGDVSRKTEIAFGGLLVVLTLVCWWSVMSGLIDRMKPLDGSTYSLAYDDKTASSVALGSRLLLTAGHVAGHGVGDAGEGKDFEYTVSNDYMKPVKAKALWANQQYDIGVLLADNELPYKSRIDCREANLGEGVTVIGYPAVTRTSGPVLTTGVVSSKLQKGASADEWVLIDAMASKGNSGGPVFDSKRSVIGILTTVFGKSLMVDDEELLWSPAGYSGMVPSSVICKFLGLK